MAEFQSPLIQTVNRIRIDYRNNGLPGIIDAIGTALAFALGVSALVSMPVWVPMVEAFINKWSSVPW